MAKEQRWARRISLISQKPDKVHSQGAIQDAEMEGDWLPSVEFIVDYIHDLQEELKKQGKEEMPLCPEIQKFLDLVEEDLTLRYLAAQMLSQVPLKYAHKPDGGPDVDNFKEVLRLVDETIKRAPTLDAALPVNIIFEWWMGTAAGNVFFLDPRVNSHLKIILNKWCQFLNSPESLYVLDPNCDNGWASEQALKRICIEEFEHDPTKPYMNFTSWNDFFIRRFKPGVRPVDDPDNSKIVVAACEATPFDIQHQVYKKDKFWVKKQPYSLHHLLNGHHVDDFEYGAIYQAFLSAYNYHRWHSPVDGKVVETYLIPGTYYAESPAVGFDMSAPVYSQGYIAQLASRAIVFIEADGGIGLMAVVFIGMDEVSSIVLTCKQGDVLKKGQEVGHFLFGGSSYCLIFRPKIVESFFVEAIPSAHAPLQKLNTRVCKIKDRPEPPAALLP